MPRAARVARDAQRGPGPATVPGPARVGDDGSPKGAPSRVAVQGAGCPGRGACGNIPHPGSPRPPPMPPPRLAPPAPTAWSAFKAGLLEPSLPALVGLVAVLLTWLVGASAVIDREFAKGPGNGYLTNGSTDTYGNLFNDALDLERRLVEEPGPRVLLIGASSMREGLGELERLTAPLTALTGTPVRAELLTAGALSIWEMAALLDPLREDLSGIVVLEVSPRRLSTSPGKLEELLHAQRFPFDSPWVNARAGELGIDPPARTGVFFLDHMGFFATRPKILMQVGRPPVEPLRYLTSRWRPPEGAEWERVDASAASWLATWADHADFNLECYRALIEELERDGSVAAVLVEAPSNPAVDARIYAGEAEAAALADYRRRVEGFAAEVGVPYWRPSHDLELPAEAFHDHTHLREGYAREQLTGELARRLAEHWATVFPRGADR